MSGALKETSALFCRMRVARLDATGATPAGANNMYVSDQMVEVTLDDNVQTGQEISQQTGCGAYAYDPVMLPDFVKWKTGVLTIASPSYELQELLCGGVLVTSGGNTIGYGEPPIGQQPPGFGVSLELWAQRMQDGAQASDFPWQWSLLARTKNWRAGQHRWFLGNFAPTFTFQAVENPNIGNGPNNDWPGPADRVLAVVHSALAPPAASVGYLATPAQV